jgi:type I restriction enzyme, S subunit
VIGELEPYPAYKDSGLSWLGEMPSHWQTQRSKYLFREADLRSIAGTEQRLSMSQRHGLIPSSHLEKRTLVSESNVGGKLCEAGDLVLNRLKAHLGVVAVSPMRGVVSPDYTVLRPLGTANHDYFCAVYRSPHCGEELRRRAKGIVEGFWRLYTDDFYDIRVPVPPPDEQAAIMRFLSWTNARLERSIRAKRKGIALLMEQKQVVIQRAVTNGLDGNSQVKATGIPWLSQIPQHWEVRRLRTLVRAIDQGVSPLAEGFLAEGDSWGVLKSGCVNRGVFRETEHKRLARGFDIDPAIAVKVGDVLISRACGSPSLVGSVARVRSLRYRLILSDKTFRASFRDSVDPDFMVYAMNCRYYRHQVEQAISGAEGMANNLPLSSLKDFRFAIPPKAEATRIAEQLSKDTLAIDKRVAHLEGEIELLREYRTRLVADLVTGRLDVRQAVERLPARIDVDTVDEGIDEADDAELVDAEEAT